MGTGVVEEGEALTGDNVLRYRTSMANTDVAQLVEKQTKYWKSGVTQKLGVTLKKCFQSLRQSKQDKTSDSGLSLQS